MGVETARFTAIPDGKVLFANTGLRQPHESIGCGTGCSIIVYSVRIGPPQPRNLFLSTTSANPATIRIDNFDFPSGRRSKREIVSVVTRRPLRTANWHGR